MLVCYCGLAACVSGWICLLFSCWGRVGGWLCFGFGCVCLNVALMVLLVGYFSVVCGFVCCLVWLWR